MKIVIFTIYFITLDLWLLAYIFWLEPFILSSKTDYFFYQYICSNYLKYSTNFFFLLNNCEANYFASCICLVKLSNT